MLSMSIYLVKASVYVIAFYVPFVLILRQTTFFHINRVYLIAGLVLSFVLPAYTGFADVASYTALDVPFVEPMARQTGQVIARANESGGLLNMGMLFLAVYWIGILIRLSQLTVAITGILKIKNKGEILPYQDLTVIRTSTLTPFSFFNCVFLPRNCSEPGILAHEAAHVRQYHWMDLVIMELAAALLWFNPVMIAYRRALKQQHEYLADRTAIQEGIGTEEYLNCIRQQIEFSNPVPLTSAFYLRSIKNRINMLTKKTTPGYKLSAYAIVLPLIILLMTAFSPRKHFETAGVDEQDSIQDPVSLGLPIDKQNNFSLAYGYGERLHPVLGTKRMHTGIDLVAGEGVPVLSAQDGVVTKAKLEGAWGNIIVVQHDDTYATSYSHLESMNVKEGDKVGKGQKIGSVGHTGLSSQDHLHFELLKNGKAIDPINYLPEIK